MGEMKTPVYSHLVLLPLLVIAVIVVFSVSTPYGNEVSEHGFRAGFFDLRLKDSERLLSAIGNGGQKQEALAVEFFAGGGALALRNAYDSYLTCRGGRAYFTVRTDATAKELWGPRILPDGTMALLSLASDRYLRVRRRALRCDTISDKQAAKWEPHMATRRECWSVGTLDEPSENISVCWSEVKKEAAKKKIILFGTLKPLRSREPDDPSDMYDAFIIAKRTLTNWARLPGVQPVVFTDDALNQKLVEQINAAHMGRPGISQIDVITEFEVHPTYKQPTYRGLFQKAISSYPNAEAIMYANMDILFTSSLINTVNEVRRAYERREHAGASMKGWFIIGQRTNVTLTANWSMDDEQWESRLETELHGAGRLYSVLAQDYFIMNPTLFNWSDIPPFIVGGVVFDNWLTSKAVIMGQKGSALTVDATRTLIAVHENHAEDLFASRRKPKSRYNVRLMRANGGRPYRLTSDSPCFTLRLSDRAVHCHKR
ncbi:glycosyl transferase family 2 [Trypanosoma grayi]|uniref:glycosyl transferase family 2 n=1 Tax=Trypanosoma grayi TaxID=71804 RepID=UPI0004F46C9E|nr:glycosyl transferase family 2 [Trypanosoma grayi]KEG08574.1 glycosyl transferase family 2 [Trypanosoma grayi]